MLRHRWLQELKQCHWDFGPITEMLSSEWVPFSGGSFPGDKMDASSGKISCLAVSVYLSLLVTVK